MLPVLIFALMLWTIFLYLLILIVSLTVLIKSSDFFVHYAERIGRAWGIPSFIIGVTIIAFGTSLPELSSSIVAVVEGHSSIVLGSVIGSNITNVLLVLGIVAVMAKSITLQLRVLDLDVPLLIVAAILSWFALIDGHFSTVEALLFLVALTSFIANTLSNKEEQVREIAPKVSWKSYLLLVLAGLGVFLGAKYTVFGIKELATLAHIKEEFIAITLVALGTSLPEVMVSISAVRQGKTDMAVGNIIGSNVFNTFAVLSIPSFFGTLEISTSILNFGLPFMVAITVLFGFICVTGRISRWEGLMLLTLYGYFVYELILEFINGG